MTKEEGKKQIKDLVRKFERMPDHLKKTYNEEQTKKNLILLLFEALGWDIRSDEVQAEEKVSGGRVDYAFKLGDITKFYLEAKPIREDLDKHEEQLIDYAYNKDVTWGVLTNFKELRIFNALEKTPRPITFTFKDYLKDFDLLWLISKESFETGEINKWAQRLGIESIPVPPVGERLAKDLTEWRDELTDYISKWEEKLSQEEVDEAVQKFLDRLIFIRVAEDRGLEEKVLLPLYHSKDKVDLIAELNKLFREFDKKYDSTLFHKHFSEDLELEGIKDNIANIIKRMHITKDEKRYEFRLIDADILGAVYEQYLGTIQRKGEGTKRKEQGIYYTPKFIVNYIVENTLGKLLREEMTPISEVKKLKILDPACGSGSFLIRAFEVLDKFYEGADVSPSRRRKHILTKNLYGVDLDPKAIEVAQLNLMLSAAKKRELLPELHENLKIGNSLISGKEKELRRYFGEDWEEKKPFNWEEEFPRVFEGGGFDVIIGNPPYISTLPKDEKKYYEDQYRTRGREFDTFFLFIERSLKLLREGGILGFIIPNTILLQKEFENIRKFILDNSEMLKILDLKMGVFKGAVVPSAIVVVEKRKTPRVPHKVLTAIADIEKLPGELVYKTVPQQELASQQWYKFDIYSDESIKNLLNKVSRISEKLENICDSHEGVHSGNIRNKLFSSRSEGSQHKKLLQGKNILEYQVNWGGKYVNYNPEIVDRAKGEYASLREERIFLEPKIMTRQTADSIIATYDEKQFYTDNSIHCSVKKSKSPYNLKYVLAILNSRLTDFIYKQLTQEFGRVFPQVKIVNLKQLPIKKIDISDKNEQLRHDKLVKLADKMLNLSRQLQVAAEGGNKWRRLKSKIEKTDEQIDKLVYKLYNLTPEEIKLVETNISSN